MKKIIALLLSLVLTFGCVMALASCGECDEHVDADGDRKCDECDEDYIAPVNGVAQTLACYANSQPTKIVTTSNQSFYEIDYDGSKFVAYELNGKTELVTGTVNGLIATVEKSTQQRIRNISDVAEIKPVIETFENSDEFLQGYGRRSDAILNPEAEWDSTGYNFAPSMGAIAINITNANVNGATYTEAPYNNVFAFTIAKDKAEEVLGQSVTTDTDISIIIVNDGAVVTSITIEYGIMASGNFPERKITITTEYGYVGQKVDLIA